MKRWSALPVLGMLLGVFAGGCEGLGLQGAGAPPSHAEPAGRGGTGLQAAPPASAPVPAVPPDPVRERLKGMTLDEKIGQLLLAGLDGTGVDEHARTLLGTYHAGGLILYQNNVKDAAQLGRFTNELKAANRQYGGAPLWLSVDEEGGRVSRMPPELVKLPSAARAGVAGRPEASFAAGGAVGAELAAFGLNVDFAPVLDVFSNPDNPVIGDRSFGSDPALVGRLGVQTMKGLQSKGVTAVVKHFPGHGDTTVDSHIGLPVISHDLQRLRSRELKPFAEAVGSGADAVMVAHLLLPKLDEASPASLSKPVITGLLRGELGFTGVVFTDDLTMGAVVKHYELGAAAVRAVDAGADVLLVGHGFEAAKTVFAAVKGAVAAGTLSEARIGESAERILRLKAKYRVSDEAVPAADVAKLNALLRGALQELGVPPGGPASAGAKGTGTSG